MENSYNLLKEPWIPVLDGSGNIIEMGIINLLKKAHEYIAISDSSPLMQYGIYRLLIAIVSDMFDIIDITTIDELLEIEGFDNDVIDSYAEKWHDRFYLFHNERPFYQAPLNEEFIEKKKSISELFFHIPTGNNPIHFFHKLENSHAITPKICARGLCTLSAFTPSGGQGLSPSINKTPPWYVIIIGNNLFETLILNCCGIPIEENANEGEVAWKQDIAVETNKKKSSASTLEGLTWQPRYISLIPDKGGRGTFSGKKSEILVRNIIFEQGWKLEGDWVDPHVPYKITKKGKYSLRPLEDQRMWQHTGPLLLLSRGTYKSSKSVQYEKPIIITQFQELKYNSTIEEDRPLIIEIYGLRSDKAKKIEWQVEKLGLPLNLVLSKEAGIRIQSSIDIASKVSHLLKSSLRKMKPRDNKYTKNIFSNIIKSASSNYWDELESEFKDNFILKLSKISESDHESFNNLLDEWKSTLKKVGFKILKKFIGPLDSNAEFIKRQLDAEKEFHSKINNILSNEKKKE